VVLPRSIRAALPDDAAVIAAVYAPYVEDTAISFEATPPDAAEMRRRILARPRLPWLVATRGDDVVGYAYASQHRTRAAYRWSVDSSVYLAEQEHGHGTGRALYEQLFGQLRDLGFASVYAGIALPNDASVGLHEAMGFQPVGVYRQVGFKLGRWYDVGWWQLGLADAPESPAEPREWSPGC
jgi:phosphinothricin acetyltransferase